MFPGCNIGRSYIALFQELFLGLLRICKSPIINKEERLKSVHPLQFE